MKIGIYEGVDSLVTALLKKDQKDNLNNLLAEGFPHLFGNNRDFVQHLFTIPLPIRDKFTFFLLYGRENTGIPLLDKEIVLAFGMLDCSKYVDSQFKISDTLPYLPRQSSKSIPTLKNVCRKQGVAWKGIGKHILRSLDTYMQRKGIPSVGLKVEHANLIQYYTKFGYVLRDDIHKNYMVKSFS